MCKGLGTAGIDPKRKGHLGELETITSGLGFLLIFFHYSLQPSRLGCSPSAQENLKTDHRVQNIRTVQRTYKMYPTLLKPVQVPMVGESLWLSLVKTRGQRLSAK